MKTKNVFANRNFTLVYLEALVSNVTAFFYSFAVSFYILQITGDNALIQGLYLATGGIFIPASATLLPQIVKEEQFHQARSYFSILSSVQSIVGVILAGA